jgi:hypothetical protein
MLDKTAPYDLAIAFRGIPRRLREAQGDSGPHGDSVVDGLLAKAAAVLHTTPDATAIAHAIESVPADEWDQSALDQIRAIALDLGAALRQIAAHNGHGDD